MDRWVTIVIYSPSHFQLFTTQWTAAHQASLSLTISRSLPKFMSIASSHLILCCLLPLLPSVLPSIRVTIKNTQKSKIQNLGLFDSKWLKKIKTFIFYLMISYRIFRKCSKTQWGEVQSPALSSSQSLSWFYILSGHYFFFFAVGSLVAKSCSTYCEPMSCSLRLLCLWDFPRKGTGLSRQFLLWGIFLTKRSNLGLLLCRQSPALL